MSDKNKDQAILEAVKSGKPVIVGTFITAKTSGGESVSERSGKVEAYAKLMVSVLCGQDVITVTQYAKDEDVPAYRAAAEDPERLKSMVTAVAGDTVVVNLVSLKFDKGLMRATGSVKPV